MYTCIYIYIYVEGKRETYIYIYIYIHMKTGLLPRRRPRPSAGDPADEDALVGGQHTAR